MSNVRPLATLRSTSKVRVQFKAPLHSRPQRRQGSKEEGRRTSKRQHLLEHNGELGFGSPCVSARAVRPSAAGEPAAATRCMLRGFLPSKASQVPARAASVGASCPSVGGQRTAQAACRARWSSTRVARQAACWFLHGRAHSRHEGNSSAPCRNRGGSNGSSSAELTVV